jgi:hypothetical protein
VRLLVFGGRTYPYKGHVHEYINRIIDGVPMDQVTIIHGDANREKRTGTDYWAHLFCEMWRSWGITELAFPAKWDDLDVAGAVLRERPSGRRYNVLAGFQRNQRMLDEGKPTHALGTPGGNGTADMRRRIELANKSGAGIALQMIESF